MKKCASCTKDLPDAALHCVFCGAKQPPAPAAPPASAKTVMGYGGPEIEALRAQAAVQQRSQAPSQPPPSSAPQMPAPQMPAPRPAGPSQPPPNMAMGNAATLAAPGQGGAPPAGMAATLASPGPGAPPAGQFGGSALAPSSNAQARTMFVEGSPPAAAPAPHPPPQAGVFHVPPPGPATLAAHQPLPPPSQQAALSNPPAAQPIAPIPAASPPYLASQTAARAGRPIEPWKDALPTMMFVFGALLIAAFVVPLTTDPMIFNWDAIIHGEGTQKLPPLILAAVGLLTVVMAAIPLGAGVRGTMALLLGLTGVFVPQLIAGMPAWQSLVSAIGMILLPMSLLARSEYREAILPRILITVGTICYALPFVMPVHGSLVIVELFKAIIDAPGAEKVVLLLMIGQFLLAVLALLCWLPSPSSGAAKPIAWMLILYPLVMHLALLFIVGDPSMISKTPNEALLGWVTGLAGGSEGGMMGVFGGLGVGVAYLALTGYGGASMLGKNLE